MKRVGEKTILDSEDGLCKARLRGASSTRREIVEQPAKGVLLVEKPMRAELSGRETQGEQAMEAEAE